LLLIQSHTHGTI